jgi:hypothetical protein
MADPTPDAQAAFERWWKDNCLNPRDPECETIRLWSSQAFAAGRASLVDASETQLTKAPFHGAAEWNLTKPRGEQFRERLRRLGLRLVVDGEAKG